MDFKHLLIKKTPVERYLKRYLKYVKLCETQILDYNEKTEMHHILPKAKDMFPEFSNFKKFPENMLKVTARQHIFCHILLAKMFPSSKSCQSAIFQMLIKPYKTKDSTLTAALKLAEFSRAKFGDTMRGTVPVVCKTSLKKSRIPQEDFDKDLYWTCADYSLNIASTAAETRKKKSNAVKGLIAVIDSDTGKFLRVSKSDFDDNREKYVAVGLLRDAESRAKTSAMMKNRIHYHNPLTGERLFLASSETAPAGFIHGLPQSHGDGVKERFCGTVWFYNPKTGHNVRCKGNPPDGYVKGRAPKRLQPASSNLSPYED